MISIIGLGNAASKIAKNFSGLPQYSVYCLNDGVKRTSKYNFRLKRYETPEEYEENVPDLSKFFKDLKFSTLDKESVWLLCNDQDIIWVVGARTDDRYKVTPNTSQFLKFTAHYD